MARDAFYTILLRPMINHSLPLVVTRCLSTPMPETGALVGFATFNDTPHLRSKTSAGQSYFLHWCFNFNDEMKGTNFRNIMWITSFCASEAQMDIVKEMMRTAFITLPEVSGVDTSSSHSVFLLLIRLFSHLLTLG